MENKHIPLRMCVVTREMLPKKDLVRIVKSEADLKIDKSQKAQGRGFWIKKDIQVVQLAKKKKVLNKILKRDVPLDFYELLEKYVSE